MKKIIPKKSGKKDYSTDVYVATIPIVRRWQTRVISATFVYDNITLPNYKQDVGLLICGPYLFPKEDYNTTYIITNLSIQADKNAGIFFLYGIADVEQLLEDWFTYGYIEDVEKYYDIKIARGFFYGKIDLKLGNGVPYTLKDNRTGEYLAMIGYPEGISRHSGLLALGAINGPIDLKISMQVYSIWITKM